MARKRRKGGPYASRTTRFTVGLEIEPCPYHPFHCWARNRASLPTLVPLLVYPTLPHPVYASFVGSPPVYMRPSGAGRRSHVHLPGCPMCTSGRESSGGWDGVKRGSKRVKTTVLCSNGRITPLYMSLFERFEQKVTKPLPKVNSRLLTSDREIPVPLGF